MPAGACFGGRHAITRERRARDGVTVSPSLFVFFVFFLFRELSEGRARRGMPFAEVMRFVLRETVHAREAGLRACEAAIRHVFLSSSLGANDACDVYG